MIHFVCPHCYREISISDQAEGRAIKCRGCQRRIFVPEKRRSSKKPLGRLIGGIGLLLFGFFWWLIFALMGSGMEDAARNEFLRSRIAEKMHSADVMYTLGFLGGVIFVVYGIVCIILAGVGYSKSD